MNLNYQPTNTKIKENKMAEFDIDISGIGFEVKFDKSGNIKSYKVIKTESKKNKASVSKTEIVEDKGEQYE